MISEVILQNALIQPGKVALAYGDDRVTYEQLAHAVNEINLSKSGSDKFFIDSADPIKAISELLACQLGGVIGMIVQADIPADDKAYLSSNEGFVELRTSENRDLQDRIISKNQAFLGVLTSGSTGIPKVILKDNDCWEKAFPHQSSVFGITADDNILVLDALTYSANLNTVLHGLWSGATVTLCSLAKANTWWKLIQSQGISSVFMVPSHLTLLSSEVQPNQIRSIVTAGEKLGADLATQIRSNFPKALLTEYYGTAELGHITYHQNTDISSNPLSVGRAFPEVEISIKNNQLYVDSPYVSPAFKKLKTVGDLGVWENGKLVLLGRAGKMFNRRGLNIFAQEIEQKILANPWVKEACLVEVERNKKQKLVLFFSRTEQFSLEMAGNDLLSKYLNAVLPLAKRPNQLVEVTDFPRLPNGKVSEKGLKLLLNYEDEEVVV